MTKKVIETTNGWYMENEKEKVELEDIIGLVQTDEQTNSVQLKKEAQLSICEKRLIELEKENEQLKQSNERIVKDIDLALGFIRHKGYSLQDIKDYEDAKKEYEEDLAYYRKGDVE